MNLNIPNSLFMHAHVLPGKYLEMYLKFNDCRHYIQAFIYNPLWYKLTMLRHPALLCSLHVRFESVQVSFIFLYVYYHNLSMFVYSFIYLHAEKPKIQPIVWEGSSPSTTQQPRPRPINTRGTAPRGQLQNRGTRGGTFQRARGQMQRGRGASRGARGGAYRSPNMYWWLMGHISDLFLVLGEFSYDKCSLISWTI